MEKYLRLCYNDLEKGLFVSEVRDTFFPPTLSPSSSFNSPTSSPSLSPVASFSSSSPTSSFLVPTPSYEKGDKGKDRESEKDKEKDKSREGGKEKDKDKEKEREKEREREREREKEREKERENEVGSMSFVGELIKKVIARAHRREVYQMSPPQYVFHNSLLYITIIIIIIII